MENHPLALLVSQTVDKTLMTAFPLLVKIFWTITPALKAMIDYNRNHHCYMQDKRFG